ncbi:MAG: hypothetical protein AWT59_2672 [Candidatus Gallionella acididurans]|uniref:Uncharacterized protein n=1 Tax=Candidatus Gallionella acididurans TaxID=1796491 RepID=A0A139BQG1_9PROT|nr:MAG: hypothetical protein AWT59_2672 [Candidatus Gallionella acididurans]
MGMLLGLAAVLVKYPQKGVFWKNIVRDIPG